MTMRLGLIPVVLLLAACGGGGEGEGSADTTQTPVPGVDSGIASNSAVPMTADSAARAPSAPPVALPDTGYTAWDALELPSEPWMQRAATPEALLVRVRDVAAAQLEEPNPAVLPSRMQVQAADSAVGIVVHPDLADDSVRDIEFRLHMRRYGAEWAITGVDRRERCRRGVTPDGDLCL
ncbi:hypothetical protein [Longimicrobium sp.]|uniref:hypothetical protein n=1 Tax=Longimicrobium sp. TaxID=2029185 RepID=UPI002E37AA52|nr:hypothetical protein [Longimicrobium sp.]HEX6041652.1 hypothetical protein [Longimicrobium sp.]